MRRQDAVDAAITEALELGPLKDGELHPPGFTSREIESALDRLIAAERITCVSGTYGWWYVEGRAITPERWKELSEE